MAAWLLLRQAGVTAGRLADPAAGAQRAPRSFCRGKAATAAFFARAVLQPVAAHRPRGRCPHDAGRGRLASRCDGSVRRSRAATRRRPPRG
ncbi:acyl-CoA dehydrogenase C-terminal domain-containing protein [Streptomyces sp. x-80]|uniref:acyl-CoA dehydrogenase C-terminal domain-containing protein n=1 Tax=Streptomyces sp. x-80 TaxID=2789282 RepID=UPI00397E9A82